MKMVCLPYSRNGVRSIMTLMVEGSSVGGTGILFRAFVRAGFLLLISRNFCSSIMRMMRMEPFSRMGRRRLLMSTEPVPFSKKRWAWSRQRMMFLAE